MQSHSARRTAFRNLGDYLKINLENLQVERVLRLLEDLQIVNGLQSHSGKLAKQMVDIIKKHWADGSLDEFSLICFALMMLYEKYYDAVNLKRDIIDIRARGRLSRVFPSRHRA